MGASFIAFTTQSVVAWAEGQGSRGGVQQGAARPRVLRGETYFKGLERGESPFRTT